MVDNNLLRTFSIVTLSLFVLFNLGGCSAINSSQDPSTTKHLLPWAVTDRMLLDFTIEEEKSILESFKVVIPEDENAHVYSFYFAEKKYQESEKIAWILY